LSLFDEDRVHLSRRKVAAALLNKDGVHLSRRKVAGFFLFKKNRVRLR
jgi:hypothetical protein